MTEAPTHGGALGGQDTPPMEELDEVVELKDSVHVGQFQTEILKGRVAKPPTHDTHVMIAPLRCSKVESGKTRPLALGLQVLHAYTTLTAGNKNVSIVVQNVTNSTIFLKKGVCVVHMVSAMLVLPVELLPEKEDVTGAEKL